MRFMERAENWFAAALIVFFFLPWFGAGPFSVSGYSLTTIPAVFNAASSSGLQTSSSNIDLLYIVWLIPILSVITLVLGLTGKSPRAMAIVTGIVTLLMFGFVFAAGGGDTFKVLGIGAYLTILAAFGLILAGIGIIKAPARANAITTDTLVR